MPERAGGGAGADAVGAAGCEEPLPKRGGGRFDTVDGAEAGSGGWDAGGRITGAEPEPSGARIGAAGRTLCTGVGEADTGIFNSRGGAGAGAGAISSRSLGSGASLASVTPASLSAVVGTFCVLVVGSAPPGG